MYAIYWHEENAFNVIEGNRILIPRIWSQGLYKQIVRLKYNSIFHVPER